MISTSFINDFHLILFKSFSYANFHEFVQILSEWNELYIEMTMKISTEISYFFEHSYRLDRYIHTKKPSKIQDLKEREKNNNMKNRIPKHRTTFFFKWWTRPLLLEKSRYSFRACLMLAICLNGLR